MSQDLKIGFIGIGNMGSQVTANLSRAGFATTIYDSDPEQANKVGREPSGPASASD